VITPLRRLVLCALPACRRRCCGSPVLLSNRRRSGLVGRSMGRRSSPIRRNVRRVSRTPMLSELVKGRHAAQRRSLPCRRSRWAEALRSAGKYGGTCGALPWGQATARRTVSAPADKLLFWDNHRHQDRAHRPPRAGRSRPTAASQLFLRKGISGSDGSPFTAMNFRVRFEDVYSTRTC